ncbi:glycosyltransferase family 4 protein [Lederbergia wuyishanensis]|uniref:Glycosyltransferase involved in cell wall biosynthesis n=1 Tax=Lederbergia wuyishanensis TaxID=1347903 RepID=A0ABU0D0H7_9BACI|nr:glycosyltransferase family 4 protein [Lederbergia wuyishanensis]MCJ8006534.1 glycosyltransferase family 4 protein [Lederbergia wuyishanensis]MDQ0341913.1 glycosyltransferase involved in cell wall biosynthesis [Lederbergia wuyishanensis]
MKLLVIWRLLTVGGVNAGWRNRAIHFKKHGIHTEFLYTTDHGGLHIMQDVASVYLTKDEKKIINIIKNNSYDAIIVVDTGAAFKWIKKAKYKGPVIVEARTPELIKLQPHLRKFRGIQPKSIIVPSEYQKRLVSILSDGIPINVIYNGIDTSFFRILSNEEIDEEELPVIPNNKKIIGWIGRVDKRKNWPMLLEIAKMIKEERNDIEIWLIGGAQSVQREEFAMKREEEQLTDIVKWFPVIHYQKMPSIYAKIRQSGGCTLATTKTESFGNTFIESMVCGVPVVASKLMPMTELVIHEETGMLYKERNVKDAVTQIYRILDDPELHQKMSIEANNHVQNHFSIQQVGDQYIELIKNIITNNNEIKNELSAL